MTGQHGLRVKFRVLSVCPLLVVVLTMVIAFSSAAEQAGTDPPLPRSSGASAPLPADSSTHELSWKAAVAGVSNSASSLFLPAVFYDTGGFDPDSVVVADVNGDGKPDLIVANQTSDPTVGFAASTVSVLLGNGDGTFQSAVTYLSGGSYLNSLAVADVNHDGKLDILAANGCSLIGQGTCSNESAVGVLLGNGNGTFQPPVNYKSGGFGIYYFKVAVVDVNGDGNADLVTLNGCASSCDGIGPPEGSIGILLGNGDGTFRAPVTYSTGGYFADSLAVGDLRGVGKIDLVVTNFCGDNDLGGCTTPGPVDVLLGNGDGTFNAAVAYGSGGQGTSSVAIADVNKDGKPDLVVGNCGSEGCGGFWPPRPGGVVGVLLGNGDGSFNPAQTYGAGSYYAVAVADVDGNGTADIISTDWACSNPDAGCVSVLLGNGDGTFQSSLTYALGAGFSAIALADADGDGRSDLLVTTLGNFGTNTPPGLVGVLLNSSGSTQTPTTISLVSSLNPSIIGQAITFTASVNSRAGVPPNGETISFRNGSAILGTASLSSGMAVLTTSLLPAGVYTITASYPGDANFSASTSPGLRQAVNSTTKLATATTLVSSLNPSIYGQKVTWTATVATSGAVTPTGKVKFTWGIYTLGTVTLNSSGAATLTKSNLNADTYPVIATYSGDANNLSSTSPVVNQVVSQATSSAKLTSSPNPSTSGQAVTFTATITSPTVKPTGPVTFSAGKTVLGTAELSGGKATFTTSTLAVGSTTVTATYFGDSNIAGSSASVTQSVQP